MLGCTVPAAKNYNPAATEDDGSCIYLNRVGGQCYQFGDAPADQLIDHSFTLSLLVDDKSLEPKGWVFYHDYFPDFYLHTRDRLLNLQNNTGFYNNEGPRGVYHTNTVKPFFIDVLFSDKNTMVLNSVNWIAEVRNTGNDEIDDQQPALYNETLTAVTIWNNYQSTGRVPLDAGVLSLEEANNRNSEQVWHFNEFRNLISVLNQQFLEDIFHDFITDPDLLNPNLPWFEKRLIEGNYFIVRFEFNNNTNKQITIHNVDADVTQSYR